MVASLGSCLTGQLLDLDDDELCGLERSKAHEDVHDAQVLISGSRGLAVALHKVGLTRRCALKSTLPEQALHECTDIQSNLGPERFVVWLEHDPLRSAEQALIDVECDATHPHV